MYTDINARFPEFNELAYTQDMQDIIGSLERLFSTRIGSVPFNRSYGTSLYSLLFENNNTETYQIEMLLLQDIQLFEPRIQLGYDDVSIKQVDEHTYSINVKFSVPALNYVRGTVSSIIKE